MRTASGVDHTLYTLLIDRNGVARVLFDALARPPAIAHDVRLVLADLLADDEHPARRDRRPAVLVDEHDPDARAAAESRTSASET